MGLTAPELSEPTPEQLRRGALRAEVRRSRNILTTAVSALDHIERRLAAALDKALTAEACTAAYDDYQKALLRFAAVAKFITVPPSPQPPSTWMIH